ncbi:hypothetical protein [Zhenhengia yiwuensis]
MLQEHIHHCVMDAVENNDMKVIKALNKAIHKFIK